MAVKENVNIKSKASEKNNHFKFFKEMKAEVKRITWPSKDDTKKALRNNIINYFLYVYGLQKQIL